MSVLSNCTPVIFRDLSTIELMNSTPVFESSASSSESSEEFAAAQHQYPIIQNVENDLHEAALVNGGKPFLKIIEEPVEKFRFRYKSEMLGTHGCILARSHEKNQKKKYPAVQLLNYDRQAIIRCSLYTAQPNKKKRTLHTHRLIMRADNQDKDDPHEIIVSRDNNYTANFRGMGIIHTAKKNIVEELVKKKRTRFLENLQVKNKNITRLTTVQENQLKEETEKESRKMDLNSVSLCFEACYRDSNNCLHQICDPVFSEPIYNMKSALTGELKICRIDKLISSCKGGEEIFILVEKVGKKNIQIKFFEVDEDGVSIWESFGKFSELDVHHQYAIVFRTPPYQNQDIEERVNVFVQLYRPSDGACSTAIPFQYKPSEKMCRTRRKRQRTCTETLSSGGDQTIKFPDGKIDLPNDNNELENDLRPTSQLCCETEALDILLKDIELADNVKPATDVFFGSETKSSKELLVENELESDLCDSFNETHTTSANEFLENNGMYTSEFEEFLDTFPLKDYMRTFEENQDISADGEETSIKTNQSLISSRNVSSIECEGYIRTEIEDEAVVKREVAGDINLLQKAIMLINTALKEKLSSDAFAKEVQEIFNTRNEMGDNALHAAVMRGQRRALQLMLQVLSRGHHNSVVNCENFSSETPLHLAVLHNQPEFVKMLIRKGADPNCVNESGNTPIHLAIHCAHNECLYELLNKNNYIHNNQKPKVDKKNDSGQAPLHFSALKKNLFAVKYLVENGANVNAVDSTLGRHVLLVAAEEGNKDIVQYLIKETKVDVNLTTYTGYSALHYACVENGIGNMEIYRLLKDAKANLFKANNEQLRRAAKISFGAVVEQAEKIIKEEIESEDNLELYIFKEESEEEEDDDDDIEEEEDGDDLTRNVEADGEVQVKEEHPYPSVHTSVEDNGLFDEETLGKLCPLLDTSKGWTNLADLLDYTFLVPSFRNAISPTKLLFNYIDLHGTVTVQNIRNFLEALDEVAAVAAIDYMLARQIADHL